MPRTLHPQENPSSIAFKDFSKKTTLPENISLLQVVLKRAAFRKPQTAVDSNSFYMSLKIFNSRLPIYYPLQIKSLGNWLELTAP